MRRGALLAVAATLVLAAPARGQSTITMSGSVVTRALARYLRWVRTSRTARRVISSRYV